MTVATDPTNGCFYHRPTLAQRLARALGFRFRLGEEPKGADRQPGWAKTKIRLRLSPLDRVRLLATGKLDLDVTHYIDRPVDRMVNRVDLTFPAPWERD
jgi:hypothetical protein